MDSLTPNQLARALERVKKVLLPAQVARLTVSPDPEGKCLVQVLEERREKVLGIVMTVELTAEETRAWRAECQRASGRAAP